MGSCYALVRPIQFGFIAITCTWKGDIERDFHYLSGFLRRLEQTIIFFCGVEPLRQAGVLEKRLLLESILDMSIKGRQLNFDALQVDFIRRASPPTLRRYCVPHDPKLRLFIEEHWCKDTVKMTLFINNPITNDLLAQITYQRDNSNQHIEINPDLIQKDEYHQFCLGYYPVMEGEARFTGSPVTLTGQWKGDSLKMEIISKVDLRDVSIKINAPKKIDYMIACERWPGNLIHKVTYKKHLSQILWRLSTIHVGDTYSCTLQFKLNGDDVDQEFSYEYARIYLTIITHHIIDLMVKYMWTLPIPRLCP